MKILSNDFGNGNIKTFDERDGGTLLANHSALAQGSIRYEDVYEEDGDSVQLIEFNGAQIYAGLGAHRYGKSLGDLSYERITQGTDEMRSVLYAAWSNHFKTPRRTRGEYSICVQLPVSLMQAGNAADTKSKIESWLLGEHAWMSWDQEFSLSIGEVTLQSQAGAAVFDHVFDLKGQPVDENLSLLSGEIAVISVGMGTVEGMVLDYGQPMHNLTFSTRVGVSELLSMLDGGRRGLHRADAMLRAGRYNGKLDSSVPQWASQVRAHIMQRWAAQMGNFDAAIFVGGGIQYVKDQLRDMFTCRVVMADDPIMSIARGGYKKGTRDASRKAEKEG